MTASLGRLLILLAVLVMPMGMASAADAAHAVQSAPAGHCDDSKEMPATDREDCTAACNFVAMDGGWAAKPTLFPPAPRSLAPAAAVRRFEPETATPPPRLA